MADQSTQRRLAAILAADGAGYTQLMEKDADGTVAAWQAIERLPGHLFTQILMASTLV